jgi:hypothetical protein
MLSIDPFGIAIFVLTCLRDCARRGESYREGERPVRQKLTDRGKECVIDGHVSGVRGSSPIANTSPHRRPVPVHCLASPFATISSMSIPDYQTLMRPLLELLADVEEHAHRARKGVFITTVNVQ